MDRLQLIVDDLADELGRSISLEDRQLRLLYNSPHTGPVDASRYECLLKRAAGDEVRDWIFHHGIGAAIDPVTIEPNPVIGVDFVRHCFPVRCQDSLLGYLIVIDPQRSVAGRQIPVCQDVAEMAGAILYRDKLLEEAEGGHVHELLEALLGPDAATRADAARTLVEDSLFFERGAVGVLVAQIVDELGGLHAEKTDVAMRSALRKLRRLVDPRAGLELCRIDHGVFLVSAETSGFGPGTLRALAGRLQASIVERMSPGEERWQCRVGVGDLVRDLGTAHRSYEQAMEALEVARRVPGFARVVEWSNLNAYQLLARFPLDEPIDHWLHAGLRRLFEEDSTGQLVETLETYLDLGGDARLTAERVVLHRASLYRRLQRVEQIAGVSLRRGEDRLALHMGLKLARLAGAHPYPGQQAPAPATADTDEGVLASNRPQRLFGSAPARRS
jgi:hypothetical protein